MKPARPASLSSHKYFWFAIFVVLLLETYRILPPRPAVAEAKPPVPYTRGERGEGHHEGGRSSPVEKSRFHPPSQSPPSYREGIIHVHSTFSDGGGSPAAIAEAGEKAGMDFVVLTDHNTSAARREGFEKTYGKTDLYVEMEANTPAGHALLFFSHTDAVKLSDPQLVALAWDHFLSRSTIPGIFLSVAHPSNVKNPWTHLDRFPDGLEVVNFDSVWQREASDNLASFLLTAAVSPFNNFLGALRFFEIYPRDFAAWDDMNSISKGHFGILGQDTHEKIILTPKKSLKWPTYRQSFRLASNIVYYDEPLAPTLEGRKKQLYSSIHQGRLAIVYQAVYPFAGNDWRLQCGTHTYRPGDEAPAPTGNGRCDFIVQTPPSLPYRHLVRLIKTGAPYREVPDVDPAPTVTIPADGDGVYRVEVGVTPRTPFRALLNHPVPYVFYNPIYIR